MRILDEARYLLRTLLKRRDMDADLDAELHDHLEREAAARIARGEGPDTARQAAAAAFGGVTRIAEEARDVRGWRWLDDLGVDIRHAFRLLRRYPWFSAAVIGIAALGIGASTVVYSAVYGVMIRPLPFPTADRVMYAQLRAGAGTYPGWSPENFRALSGETQVIAAAGMYSSNNMVLLEQGVPENVAVEALTPPLLSMLAVRPVLGRLFIDDDAQRDLPVVLLGQAIWRDRFGGDSSVVGRSITLSGRSYTVIGVMPRDFTGPRLNEASLWVPARVGPTGLVAANGKQRGGSVFVMLREGIATAQAEQLINSHLRLGARDILNNDSVSATVSFSSLRSLVVLDQGTPLLILMGAVTLVLVLVASNVATMGLARAAVREHEMAIRQALGAGRSRQVRQILTETVLLTAIGGLLGVALARFGLALFVQGGSDILPRIRDIRMDAPVLLFACTITIGAGLVAALAPSLARRDGHLADSFTGTPGRGGSARGQRLRSVLVASEVALSIMLLVGAGLLLKGFLKVIPTHPGFAIDHRINLRFAHGPAGDDTLDHAAFARNLLARVRELPGVRDAAIATMMPLVRIGSLANMRPEGLAADAKALRGWQVSVSPGYFAVMQTPIVRGRDLQGATTSVPVVVVNETAAAKWWPGTNPLGKSLEYSRPDRSPVVATVIGVSHDVRSDGERTSSHAEFYVPFDQSPERAMNLVVHASADPRLLEPAIKREIWRLAPGNPVSEVSTLQEIASDSVKNARFYTTLIGIFAGIAVLLSAAGIFSVMAYTVSRRTREIGIRLAVGASRRDVAALVLRQSAVIALAGLVIGLGGARLLSRYLESLLLEVTPTDTAVFASAAGALLLVTVAACALPLRRALMVDPVRSLRAE